jgi:23S rRNA G2445 N2-methylase RlmL
VWSGTILIEAAMMAADIAPVLLRWSFGFQNG